MQICALPDGTWAVKKTSRYLVQTWILAQTWRLNEKGKVLGPTLAFRDVADFTLRFRFLSQVVYCSVARLSVLCRWQPAKPICLLRSCGQMCQAQELPCLQRS